MIRQETAIALGPGLLFLFLLLIEAFARGSKSMSKNKNKNSQCHNHFRFFSNCFKENRFPGRANGLRAGSELHKADKERLFGANVFQNVKQQTPDCNLRFLLLAHACIKNRPLSLIC